jgi:hypothetical protein
MNIVTTNAYWNTLINLDFAGIPTWLTWAVCSLVLNTVLSTSIIAKIV